MRATLHVRVEALGRIKRLRLSFQRGPLDERVWWNIEVLGKLDGQLFARLLDDLKAYFEGLEIDHVFWYNELLRARESGMVRLSGNSLKALKALSYLKRGELISYSQLGRMVGLHPRAVARAMASNPYPILIPCHRVVAKEGLGGYTGGKELKRFLLSLEGSAEIL